MVQIDDDTSIGSASELLEFFDTPVAGTLTVEQADGTDFRWSIEARDLATEAALGGPTRPRNTCTASSWRADMANEHRLTKDELSRALTRSQRKRIIAGQLEPGDVAALRRFVCLTQEQFAERLGISVHTLRNWEQDRVTPDGPGLALLSIAARHPRIIREDRNTAA